MCSRNLLVTTTVIASILLATCCHVVTC